METWDIEHIKRSEKEDKKAVLSQISFGRIPIQYSLIYTDLSLPHTEIQSELNPYSAICWDMPRIEYDLKIIWVDLCREKLCLFIEVASRENGE